MRFLHTSDWHVGKVLKGHDRLDEHRAVLAEIVAIADEQRVDAVFVVGDLFETALPSPDAQQLVWETLIALRRTGAEVIVVAGNHDNAGLFEAMSALFAAIGITMVGRPRRPNAGGIVRFSARETGEPVEVALLPFVSQRGIVTSLHLMGEDMAAAQLSQTYALRMQRVISALSDAFTSDAIRVFLVHAHVHGGLLGGGEREAQTIFDYGISPAVFPTTAHYVGLGHLHRMQKVAGPCPIHYCGSPVQVDFGEEADSKQVLLVEVSPRTPARATPVRLTQPRVLRTVEGSESELRQRQGEFGDALLRIRVKDTPRSAGLADRIREWFPNALEVRIEIETVDESTRPEARHDLRSPAALFADFLAESNVSDERLTALFSQLLDAATLGEAALPIGMV